MSRMLALFALFTTLMLAGGCYYDGAVGYSEHHYSRPHHFHHYEHHRYHHGHHGHHGGHHGHHRGHHGHRGH